MRPTVVRCESVMSYRGVPYAAVRVMWLGSVSVDVETNVPYGILFCFKTDLVSNVI